MRKKISYKKRFLSLVLASAVLLTGCGGREEQAGIPSKIVGEAVESVAGPGEDPAAEAVTMHLRKTEGAVDVADGEGARVPLLEQMGLYSGYQVDTREESYAWIDLDSVKLTKMDVDSRVNVRKTGKRLGIFVQAGSLFFHVEEPLGPEESLDICTSNMMVGIRGTCGWVDAADPMHMKVGILEGVVSCSSGSDSSIVTMFEETFREPEPAMPEPEPTQLAEPARVPDPVPVQESDSEDAVTETPVPGGYMAELTLAEDGQPRVTVRELTVKDIPDFVLTEVVQDPELCEKILAETGLDVLNGDQTDWTAALEGIAYYGDAAQCAMTREQAEAFAEVLRNGMTTLEADYDRIMQEEGYAELAGEFRCYAGLFDSGDGIPLLMFGGGGVETNAGAREDGMGFISDHNGNDWEIWRYAEGQAVRIFPREENADQRVKAFYLYPDFLRYEESNEGLSSREIKSIYRFEAGLNAERPDTMLNGEADMDMNWTYSIDGSPASQEESDGWVAQWGGTYPPNGDQGYQVYVTNGSEVGLARIEGLCPAEDVLAVLENTQER